MQATLEWVRAVPGVVAAGGSNMMPLDNRAYLAGFPARPIPDVRRRPAVATTLRYAVTLLDYAFQVQQGRLIRRKTASPCLQARDVFSHFAAKPRGLMERIWPKQRRRGWQV